MLTLQKTIITLAHDVYRRLVVELKATGKIGDKEEQQLRNYLHILGLNHGLLINFQAPGQNTKGRTKLEIQEVHL
ncbi:MAG: GxxExxY protein [Parcubacteria group bacterium]